MLYHPYARAEALCPECRREKLEEMNKAATVDGVLDNIRANTWIGSDFLFWLFYQTLSAGSEYPVVTSGPVDAGTEFIAYTGSKLALVGSNQEGKQKVVVSGPQRNYEEVKTALRQGKAMTEGSVVFELGDQVFKLSTKADRLSISGLSMPPLVVEDIQDLSDRFAEQMAYFYERMGQIETALQLFDSLFSVYLGARLSPTWAAIREDAFEVISPSDRDRGTESRPHPFVHGVSCRSDFSRAIRK